jgi:hypothetical protein
MPQQLLQLSDLFVGRWRYRLVGCSRENRQWCGRCETHTSEMSVDIRKRSINIIDEARLGKNDSIVNVAIPTIHM